MKYGAVVANLNYSGNKYNHLFPIKYLPDGTKCIQGRAKDAGYAVNEENIFVFSKNGGLTPCHPTADNNIVLYEFDLGDYVGIYRPDRDEDILFLDSYEICFYNESLATGVPAML